MRRLLTRVAPVARPARRGRGFTLLEVMMSLAVVLVGMLMLFRVMSVGTTGAIAAHHIAQGTTRVQQVMDSISGQPVPTLDCLVNNPTNWTTCETQCKNQMSAVTGSSSAAAGAPQVCVFTSLSLNKSDKDFSQQQYAVVFDPAVLASSTWVKKIINHYEMQVTVGWNDGNAPPPYLHKVTAMSSVWP